LQPGRLHSTSQLLITRRREPHVSRWFFRALHTVIHSSPYREQARQPARHFDTQKTCSDLFQEREERSVPLAEPTLLNSLHHAQFAARVADVTTVAPCPVERVDEPARNSVDSFAHPVL